MAYIIDEQRGLTKEQAEALELAKQYEAMMSCPAWADLRAFIGGCVDASQKTVYDNPSQDPHVAFGLLKRWQERGAMRDLIDARLRKMKEIIEDLKEESNEHNHGDSGTDDQQ